MSPPFPVQYRLQDRRPLPAGEVEVAVTSVCCGGAWGKGWRG